ncbi:hypothetical protein [Bifidobacterium lemurum]|nr:hypothetical protein [Bifidobacterium lemurum]
MRSPLLTRGITLTHVESFAITTTDHLAVTATMRAIVTNEEPAYVW